MSQSTTVYCALDIETIPHIPAGVLEIMMADVHAPKNYKDPAKIADYIAKEREAIVARAALSPLTGRIVCAGVATASQGSNWEPEIFLAREAEEESTLLTSLLAHLDQVAGDSPITFITYNGKGFDMPYLAARSMIHGVVPPDTGDHRLLWPCGFAKGHVDLYQMLGKQGKMGEWGLATLGLDKLGEGRDVTDLVANEEWQKLTDYNMQDLRILCGLFDRFRSVARWG